MLSSLLGLGARWLGPKDNNNEQIAPQRVISQNVIQGDDIVTGMRAETSQDMGSSIGNASPLALQRIVARNVGMVRKNQIPKPYRLAQSAHQVRKRREENTALTLGEYQNKITQEQKQADLRRIKQELLERSRAFFTKVEPAPKKADLISLTDEQRTMLDSYVKQPRNKLLGEPYKVQIRVDELRRLCAGDWLNDAIIDVLLSKCTEDLERVFAFTTHFYTKLENDGPQALRRWAIRKKLNVLQQDKIIVPVNRGNMHWCLAIIDNKAKSMAYYDSLAGPGGEGVLDNLESYILMEADRLEPQNAEQNRAMIKSYKRSPAAECPRQTNGSDCGVFATQTAYLIANDAPLDYSQADLDTVRENFAYTILQLAINSKK